MAGGLRVRVRIGLHTGTPSLGDEGYTGLDVVRASRIANAGHGGQILVSAQTLVSLDATPSRDLGVHRLEGLPRPERIHQLLADDLPRDFPPLRNTISTLGAGITVCSPTTRCSSARASRACSTDAGFEVVGAGRRRRDLLRHVRDAQAGRRDRRHPHAADAHRRGAPGGARDPRASIPDTGVLVLSQYVEAGVRDGAPRATAPRASATC